MKNSLLILFNLLLVICLNSCQQDSDSEANNEIEEIIQRMSIEEKVGQMTNLTLVTIAEEKDDTLVLDQEKLKDVIVNHHIGSLQNVINHGYSLATWHSLINQIQKYNLENSSHKIPFLYCIDAVHGTNYTL
ncbi:MAG: beta-glucosidase, partial [Cytophagaceae bacterium]